MHSMAPTTTCHFEPLRCFARIASFYPAGLTAGGTSGEVGTWLVLNSIRPVDTEETGHQTSVR
jgi:hypothetical protein